MEMHNCISTPTPPGTNPSRLSGLHDLEAAHLGPRRWLLAASAETTQANGRELPGSGITRLDDPREELRRENIVTFFGMNHDLDVHGPVSRTTVGKVTLTISRPFHRAGLGDVRNPAPCQSQPQQPHKGRPRLHRLHAFLLTRPNIWTPAREGTRQATPDARPALQRCPRLPSLSRTISTPLHRKRATACQGALAVLGPCGPQVSRAPTAAGGARGCVAPTAGTALAGLWAARGRQPGVPVRAGAPVNKLTTVLKKCSHPVRTGHATAHNCARLSMARANDASRIAGRLGC